MAAKASDMNSALKYIYLPEFAPLPDPTAGRRRIHVLLFHSAPANITFINDGGRLEIAGDTTRIGGFTACGFNGFISLVLPKTDF